MGKTSENNKKEKRHMHRMELGRESVQRNKAKMLLSINRFYLYCTAFCSGDGPSGDVRLSTDRQ